MPVAVPSAEGRACSFAFGRPAWSTCRKGPGSELTPFMRQWTLAKRENPDALLFFRMGDFYELFYDDAVVVSRELQLTLTARDRERSQPMCGVPYHAVESYLARLLRKGYRIAICDQMEDPKLTKKDRSSRSHARVSRRAPRSTPPSARNRTTFWRRILNPVIRLSENAGRDPAMPARFASGPDETAAWQHREPDLRRRAARRFNGRIPDRRVLRPGGAAAGYRRDSHGRRRAKY